MQTVTVSHLTETLLLHKECYDLENHIDDNACRR